MSLSLAPSLPTLVAERPEDWAAVEALVLRVFGPGRFAKTAERLREGRTPIGELSFVAWEADRPVGCVRLWSVRVGETPALLLGPFAVEAGSRSQGLGAALIERACEAAARASHRLVLLVGDAPYYGPLGFWAAPDAIMPGPVDQRRVLVRPLVAGAQEGLAGRVVAA